jgi:Fur family iron response transcriptional regulator
MDTLAQCSSINDASDFVPFEVPVENDGPDVCEACVGTGCKELLIKAGMRPTRQRVILSELLFSNGDRHVTAEILYAEALATDRQMSLATVYNTLNHFTRAGLLRRIGVDGSRSFFDTNTTAHPHFFFEDERVLVDVPGPELAFDNMPAPVPGHDVERVDVIIHVRRKPG